VSRLGRIALGTAAAAGYLWAMKQRNAALGRPPVRDLDGDPYPESTFTFSDGASVSYLDVGEGPAVLMVPGADGVKETWRHQVPAFARGHRVVAADLRSEFPPGTDFDRMARDLDELADALGIEKATVVGQSLGGPVAMRFALLHPERVRALVLSNTLARVSYEHVGLDRTLLAPVAMASTRYLPTFLGRAAAMLWSRAAVWIYDDSPGAVNVVDYALWTGPRTVSPAVSGRRVDLFRGMDLRPELGGIRAPTLVVKGPRDAYTPPRWCREIAAGIPGAAYVEIPATGHCSHVSMPGRFNRAVLRWLEAVEAGATSAPEGDAAAVAPRGGGAAAFRTGHGGAATPSHR
jgi:3-oxoadipate enol-lactonase